MMTWSEIKECTQINNENTTIDYLTNLEFDQIEDSIKSIKMKSQKALNYLNQENEHTEKN